VAPLEVAKVGRAWLDEHLRLATAEGGFERGARLQADWQRLRPEAKQILFGDSLTAALDHFFLLAKRISENPNPSGTASAMNVTNLSSLLYMPYVSKMLYTPRGVAALTKGLTLDLNPAASASAKLAARLRILKAAQQQGIPIATAAGTQPDQRPATAQR